MLDTIMLFFVSCRDPRGLVEGMEHLVMLVPLDPLAKREIPVPPDLAESLDHLETLASQATKEMLEHL